MTEHGETLAETFRSVARLLRARTAESLAPWEVSPSQFRAIGVLTRHGTMRLSELAEHLRIAARSTTEVVDALEERGLVIRSPDPHDRRAVLVGLTGRGTQLTEALRTARAADADGFFGVLDDADRAELARILELLRAG